MRCYLISISKSTTITSFNGLVNVVHNTSSWFNYRKCLKLNKFLYCNIYFTTNSITATATATATATNTIKKGEI